MAHLWDRRRHRIELALPLRLKTHSNTQALSGNMLNLSETGLAAELDEQLVIGSEVRCEFTPPQQGRLRLRGRVIWQRPAAEGEFHAGVEFADVARLQRLVREDIASGLPVSAALGDGPELPLRAVSGDAGLELRAVLPFLRPEAPVEIATPDGGDRESGVLGRACIDHSGLDPELRIPVTLETSARQRAAGLIAADRDRFDSVEATKRRRERMATLQRAEARPTSAEDPQPTLDAVVAQLELPALEPPPPSAVASQRRPRRQRRLPQPKRRTIRWAGVLALAIAAVAGVAQLGDDSETSDETVADRATLQPTQGAAATVAKAPAVDPSMNPAERPQAVVSRRGDRPSLADVTPPADQASPSLQTPVLSTRTPNRTAATHSALVGKPLPAGVELRVAGGATIVRLPVEGLSSETHEYQLAAPDGVAFNLPAGRPLLALGYHPIGHSGIEAVWVRRRRGGGLQVRVFFAGKYRTAVGNGQIVVTIAPPSDPDSGSTTPGSQRRLTG